MKKILWMGMCCVTTSVSAQLQTTAVPNPPTTGAIIFRYDEAGNQIYRGYDCLDCAANVQRPVAEGAVSIETSGYSVSVDEFWNEIHIYPVPVRDILTVAWSAEVNDLISEVNLYEQNTVHWKFQQVNMPSINRQIQIDMTRYYMGVYVLVFQLKDGRMVSKNITKF